MASIVLRKNRWRVQIRKQGYRYFSRTFLYKENAEKWARKIEYEMDQGRHLINDGRDLNLQILLARYLNEVTIHKKSRVQETYCIQKLLREKFTFIPLYKITMNEVQDFKKRRSNSPVALRHELIVIRHCLKTARSEWGLEFSSTPWEIVSLPKTPASRKRRLSEKEYEDLYKASQLMKVNYIWPAVSLAIETGMRRGELLKLQWSNINFKDRTAFLEDTKNGEDRFVPLSSPAFKLLSSLQRETERVFPISENALRLSWERLKRKAEVRDLRFHDLRHEALSRFTEQGLSPLEIAEISGYKQLGQLRAYTHLSAKRLVKRL